jgi:hypothetical protein
MGNAAQEFRRTFVHRRTDKLELVTAPTEKAPDRLLNSHEVADMLE